MSFALSACPFDDFRSLISEFTGPDEEAIAAVRARDAQLTKPLKSLGKLENLAEWVAGWQRSATPKVIRPQVAIFAANHGVVAQGVAPFPQSVTAQMVANFTSGGAAINQICKTNNIALKVFDLALDLPTPDISEEDAFDEKSCAATIAFGMEAVAGGVDLICLGEMGIGNTTIAAAIYLALYGGSGADWVGPGTGLDAAGVLHKAAIVEKAVARADGHGCDGLEVLRRLGGREFAAMVGAIIAARVENIPVIIDGYVATAAASIAHAIDPKAIDHCLFGHMSAEAPHAKALQNMGRDAILDFNMKLGEGTGAALAAVIVRSAVDLHNGMATFAEAGVDGS